MSMGFWVYMLRCAGGSYYVGHTDDIEKRVTEHGAGAGCGYTSTRRPVQVVFTEEFPSREEAIAAESQIKGWSRPKKEALIQRNWTAITRLARRRTPFRTE
jgi:predicted GIY-YIG superfamily endonuclease